jgi:hypothetical protein
MVSFIPWLLNPWRKSPGTILDEMGRRKFLPLPEPELNCSQSLFHSDIFRAKFHPLRVYKAGPGYIKHFDLRTMYMLISQLSLESLVSIH